MATYSIVPGVGTLHAANYTFGNFVNGTLTVSPAALMISGATKTKYFGQTFTFSGHEFAASGLQNSETVGSVTLTSSGVGAGVPVGSYPIVLSAATGGTFTPANYTIAYVDGTLQVEAGPTLQLTRQDGSLILTWPTNATSFSLQVTTNLSTPIVWGPAPGIFSVVGGQNVLTNTISGTGAFYRLKL